MKECELAENQVGFMEEFEFMPKNGRFLKIKREITKIHSITTKDNILNLGKKADYCYAFSSAFLLNFEGGMYYG